MRSHVQFECPKDETCPYYQGRTCAICDGGLSLCIVCGGAEAAMPTECPGVKMTPELLDLVQAKRLDYIGGRWVEKVSPFVGTGLPYNTGLLDGKHN